MMDNETFKWGILHTDNGGLEIDEDSTRYVLAGTSLAEERVEGIVTTTDGLVAGHLTVRLDAMLQTVKLPAAITDLTSGLADVHGDTLAHLGRVFWFKDGTLLWLTMGPGTWSGDKGIQAPVISVWCLQDQEIRYHHKPFAIIKPVTYLMIITVWDTLFFTELQNGYKYFCPCCNIYYA